MTENDSDPYLGKLLGDFHVHSKLGEGAMGAVYRATQVSLERDVALKILPPKLVRQHPEFVNRFLREAKVAAQISHPNIVQVHAVGVHKGIQYIAMEFVKGSSIADILYEHGPFPERKALSIVLQASRGLAAGEEKNLVHRDIKPENLLLTQDGIVKVADFGLAKDMTTESMVTQAGQIMGTPAFMSPEQGRSQSVDSRSDIYSLGVTLFQIVTGEVPYRGENPLSTILKHLDEPLPDPKSIRKDLSGFTCEIIETMMAKDPKDRFQSFQELGHALTEIPPEVSDTDMERIPDLAGLIQPTARITHLSPTSATLTSVLLLKKVSWIRVLAGFAAVAILAGAALWIAGVFDARSTGDIPKGGGGVEPELEIHEPRDGVVLGTQEVVVRGRIHGEEPTGVRVEGVLADIAGNEFSARLKLVGEGPRYVQIVAGTKSG